MHIAAHFCSPASRTVPGFETHFLKHFSVMVCGSGQVTDGFSGRNKNVRNYEIDSF